MDELVFLRETLRRGLLECVEALEKAAAAYDPEEVPMEDLLTMVRYIAVDATVRKYSELVTHRVKDRAKP